MQVHPQFSNVFFNSEGRVQIDNVTLPEEQFHFDKIKDTIGERYKHLKFDNYLDHESNVFVNKSENKDTSHKNSFDKNKLQNSTNQESEINTTNENKELRSRRVKFIDDNRKYIPVLEFDGEQNQVILQVKSNVSNAFV